MQHLINIASLLLLVTFCYGQSLKTNDETTEHFAERLKPGNSKLTHKVLAIKWNATPVILAFYEQAYKFSLQEDPGQQEYSRIIATAFIQTDSNNYNRWLIDTIDSDGGDPVIESVFPANADQDKAKELIIIASWQQQHYDVSGTLYGTFVYDNLLTNAGQQLNFIKGLSEKLSGGCECDYRDGKSSRAKFKKAGEVRNALKNMGYK